MAERQTGRTRAWILVPYVLWCALGYSFLLATDLRYLWHVPLHSLAVLLYWKPQLVLPRKGKVTPTHFVIVGIVYSAFVAEPLAVLGRGDIQPNLVLNSVFWIGSYAGVFVAWLWLLPRYRWGSMTVFVLCGLLALFDHSLALWRMLLNLDIVGFLLFAPVLHAVYSSLTAPIMVAYRTGLQRAARAPGVAGIAWATLLPGVLFRIGSLWILLAGQVLHLAR